MLEGIGHLLIKEESLVWNCQAPGTILQQTVNSDRGNLILNTGGHLHNMCFSVLYIFSIFLIQ